MPPLPKGEAMLPLSQASDRLPLRGSWQSQQALTERVVLLLDIQFGRHVDLVRDVLAVLFALTHTLGEQILDLPVHRAEVILSPRGKGIVELRIQAQGICFFGSAISTGCRCSQWAARHGCRRAPPAGWRPLPLCAHRPVPPLCSHSGGPAPSPPCPRHRPRSSYGHQ